MGEGQQVGEVGVAPGELADFGDAFGSVELALQEDRKALDVELLVGADVDQVGRIHRFQGRQLTSGHVAHQRSRAGRERRSVRNRGPVRRRRGGPFPADGNVDRGPRV